LIDHVTQPPTLCGYTKLKRGDLGSITDVTYLTEDYGAQAQIWVIWDAEFYSGLSTGRTSGRR